MKQKDCFELGIIARLHGFGGAVQLVIDADHPERYKSLDAIFLEIKGQLVPFMVEKLELSGSRAILKLQDVNSEEDAGKIKGAKAFLPLSFLPELEGNQFYFHEIVGYSVVDKVYGVLGKVKTTYSMATQDLVAMDYKGVEILIPAVDDIIVSVDRAAQILNTSLPEGLIEVYTEQE